MNKLCIILFSVTISMLSFAQRGKDGDYTTTNPNEVLNEYNLKTLRNMPQNKFDGIVMAVAHKEFEQIDFSKYLNKNGVIYDVKSVVKGKVNGRL